MRGVPGVLVLVIVVHTACAVSSAAPPSGPSEVVADDGETVRALRERLDRQERELEALRGDLEELRGDGTRSRLPVPLPSPDGETHDPPRVDFEDSAAEPPPFDTDEGDDTDDAPPLAGYDNGFFIQSADEAFRMRVNGWFQLQHTYFESEGTNLDENDFEFERIRLQFRGHFFTPSLTYFLQLDADDDQAGTVDLLDWFADYDVGHDALGCDPGRLGIRMGKWRLPHQRMRREPATHLQFADFALASIFFDLNRSTGFALFGANDWFEWEGGIFNGFQTQGLRTVRPGDVDRNFGYAGRVTSVLLGEWDNEGEPDLEPNACPAVRVGAGFGHTRVESYAAREFARLRVLDSGATLAGLLPASADQYTVSSYALDAQLKYRGMSVLFDYYFRHVTDVSGGGVPDLFDHGLLVQGGYFVVPRRLEVSARWSHVVGDSGTLGNGRLSADEVAGAVVWYIRGHDAKIVFDVTHLNGAPINALVSDIRAGDIGWLYRTQVQLIF